MIRPNSLYTIARHVNRSDEHAFTIVAGPTESCNLALLMLTSNATSWVQDILGHHLEHDPSNYLH